MRHPRNIVPPSSDEELVAAARAGSTDAFGQIFERYQPAIFRYLRRRVNDDVYRAEDLTQETFQRAFIHVGQLEDGTHFLAWLYTIAQRTLLMRERGQRRHPSISLDWLEEQATTNHPLSCVSASIEAYADREHLLEALQTLTPTLQRAFILRYVDGYSDVEIAGIEEITPAAAQSRAHRASRGMRVQLDKCAQRSERSSMKRRVE